MSLDKLFRSSHELDSPYEAGVPMGVPGKVPVTARLGARPVNQIIFRVEHRDGNGVAADADVAVERAAGTSGQALPADLRARFESSLGADLSNVRLHTGPDSAQAASAVSARAYATGNDIHFADGQFDPQSAFGVHLLAHEVAHTIQQQGAAPTRQHKLEVSGPADSAEVEADRAADAMVSGAPASIGDGGDGVQRTPDPNAPPAGDEPLVNLAGAISVKKGPLTFEGSADSNGVFTIGASSSIEFPPLVVIPPAVSLIGEVGAKVGSSGTISKDGSLTSALTGEVSLQGTINGGIPNIATVYAGVSLTAQVADAPVTRSKEGDWAITFGKSIALVGKFIIGLKCGMPGVVQEMLPKGWTPECKFEWNPGGPQELVVFDVESGTFSEGKSITAIRTSVKAILGEAEASVKKAKSGIGAKVAEINKQVRQGQGLDDDGQQSIAPDAIDAGGTSEDAAPQDCDPDNAQCVDAGPRDY